MFNEWKLGASFPGSQRHKTLASNPDNRLKARQHRSARHRRCFLVRKAAKALQASVNTLRTQLQRMLDKTGVRSQAPLIRTLPTTDGPAISMMPSRAAVRHEAGAKTGRDQRHHLERVVAGIADIVGQIMLLEFFREIALAVGEVLT